MLSKPNQTVRDPLLEPRQSALLGAIFALHVRQVRRQNEHTFDDREDERGDHHKRDLLGEGPCWTGQHGPWRKGDNRRDNTEHNRLEDQLSPDNCGV